MLYFTPMITHMQVDNRLYMDHRGSTLMMWIYMQSVKVTELFKLHISIVFLIWGKESSTNSFVFATLIVIYTMLIYLAFFYNVNPGFITPPQFPWHGTNNLEWPSPRSVAHNPLGVMGLRSLLRLLAREKSGLVSIDAWAHILLAVD
jgi:hypothetical protein